MEGTQIGYSPSTGGFYVVGVHTALPDDAVEITAEQHRALIEGQSTGKRIIPDAQGRPKLADPEPPSEAELARIVRAQRDRLLSACDFRLMPDAPGDAAERVSWVAYRQALRDITAQPGFPRTVEWPVSPAK